MRTHEVSDLIVEVCADEILPRFRALDDSEVLHKRPGDLVTVADREAEAIISQVLRDAYPGAMVLGEEEYAVDSSLLDAYRAADHAWTVDPVDGTRNFVHGSPDHAVMVSEAIVGQTVRAWIWQPQHQVAYVAELAYVADALTEVLPRDQANVWMFSKHWRLTARKSFSAQNSPTCKHIPGHRQIWPCTSRC